MTKLLEKAITALNDLKTHPVTEQDAIACDILDMLADNKTLGDIQPGTPLAKLVDEARADIASGNVFDYDPATRPS